MRPGVRAWEVVVITLLVLLVVGTTTAVHMSRLWRVVVEEASREAELISRQIYAQAGQAVSRGTLGEDPSELLRHDRDLRTLVEASVGYSPHLLYAMITDHQGRILLHTEPDKEGSGAPVRPALAELLRLDPVRRLAALYPGGTVYETALPLKLNNQPFGTIRLGLSTTLLDRELDAALKQSLVLAAIALAVAWIIAMLLARLMLYPLRALSTQVDRLRRPHSEVDSERASAGPHDRQRLRMALRGGEEGLAPVARERPAHVHGLGGRRRLIEQRGAGEREAGEVRDHGLEVEQRLQASLGDLGLIGGVGGVPPRVLEDVALDDGGHEAVVVAHADVGAEDLVPGRERAQVLEQLVLSAGGRKVQGPPQPDARGDRLVDEGFERRHAQPLEHLGDLGLVGADVPGDEAVDRREGRGGGVVLDRGGRAIVQPYFASFAT